jgi:hypothetical protein
MTDRNVVYVKRILMAAALPFVYQFLLIGRLRYIPFSHINCPEAETQLLAGKRSSVYNRNAKRWRYIIRGTTISIDERRRRKNKKIKVSFKKFFLLL